MNPTQPIPAEFLQLAREASRIVAINNDTKIFNWTAQNNQNLDSISKGIAPPWPDLKRPVLTALNAELYARIFMEDNEEIKEAAKGGVPTDGIIGDLVEAYSFYTYEPPAPVAPKEIPQPKNPLGVMQDDELGLFSPAPGDKRPVGFVFNFLGTDYIKTDFGSKFRNIGGSVTRIPMIFYVRQ